VTWRTAEKLSQLGREYTHICKAHMAKFHSVVLGAARLFRIIDHMHLLPVM